MFPPGCCCIDRRHEAFLRTWKLRCRVLKDIAGARPTKEAEGVNAAAFMQLHPNAMSSTKHRIPNIIAVFHD